VGNVENGKIYLLKYQNIRIKDIMSKHFAYGTAAIATDAVSITQNTT